MRILAFSDLHANPAAAAGLTERSAAADVVIAAGDFANGRRHLDRCMHVLRRIDKPTILVAGNNESTEELTAACAGWQPARVLHGTSATVNGVVFFGLGGGVPVTPFGPWSYDLTEEHAADLLATCPRRCVLVSHSPPKGALDVYSGGQSLGSTAVREAIARCEPRLVICGHIHACGGQTAQLGSTTIINAGPSGVEWELPME